MYLTETKTLNFVVVLDLLGFGGILDGLSKIRPKPSTMWLIFNKISTSI